MKTFKIYITIFFIFAAVIMIQACGRHGSPGDVPRQGVKNYMSDNEYFLYSFDKKPSLGMVILKVEVYDKSDKKVTGYNLTGTSGMPSMKGAHDSGPTPFERNSKGAYLLPVNVVMPGDWTVEIAISNGPQDVYKNTISFSVR